MDIIIIVSFWHATLQPFRSSHFTKNEGTNQYGYRKLRTHAQVLFPKHTSMGTA